MQCGYLRLVEGHGVGRSVDDQAVVAPVQGVGCAVAADADVDVLDRQCICVRFVPGMKIFHLHVKLWSLSYFA